MDVQHVVSATIFREYDIRGIVGKTVDEDLATEIGRAFGTYLRRKGITACVTGRDNRVSSEPLQRRVNSGLNRVGVDVIDVGMVITPMVYYAQKTWNIGGSLMVTASHNPPQYNGFKMTDAEGSLYGDAIQQLYALISAQDYESGAGNTETKEIVSAYTEMIYTKIRLGNKQLHVTFDAGNGTSGPFVPSILRGLGVNLETLYCESDPTFPHHHPDPTKIDNLQDLIRAVRQNKSDVGISLDGDGDRIGIVDNRGEIVWGDRLLILFAKDLLQHRPGSKVIVEVKCSQTLFDAVARMGGQPVWGRPGHSLIKAAMRKEGALLAGEVSGHMFFADEYYGYDDAVYAAARLLRILSHTDQPLSVMLSEFPDMKVTPEVRPHCPDEKKFEVVEKAKEVLRQRYQNIDIDGIRFWTDAATWGLIRASNTQPALIVRAESDTAEKLELAKQVITTTLAQVGDVQVDWTSQGE